MMVSKRAAEDLEASNKRRKVDGESKQATTTTDTVQQSKQLSLPPELRTAIFEYALIEEDEIEITRQLRQPALLQTSRQMRGETLPMWYLRNSFYSKIRNCDALLNTRFHTHIWDSGLVGVQVATRIHGRGRDWANLVKWCEYVWRHGRARVLMDEDMDGDEAVVAAAHDVAENYSGKPWAECEEALKTLHFVVSRLDRSWAA